ncbi:uncharacterized protein LOC6502622 [Drosophila ananassae]|uniref:uncharacterized protein LOC6502622 n=1 Tax=Drosophila ananassae TaxID=7217 RepID=UPI0013A5C21E|nr:uncharacterized protein LOC6502622 [Drosophila ananassae]
MAIFKAIVLKILFILTFFDNSEQTIYDLTIEDEDVFSDCYEKRPEYLGIDKLFDFSKLSYTMTEEGISVDGNVTFWWDIDPKDRLEASCSVSYFDRGNWQPTILNIKYKDFCATVFDPKQYAYNAWTKYVINAEYIKKVCPLPGMTFVMEPYTLKMQFGLDVSFKPGRYKIIIIVSAIDVDGNVRDKKICTELRGTIIK